MFNFCSQFKGRFNIDWEGNFFSPGEGKSDMDRQFGMFQDIYLQKYLKEMTSTQKKICLKH